MSLGKILSAALVAAPVVFGAISAEAQTAPSLGNDTGTNASPSTKPAAPPAIPYPDYGASQGYFFNLRPVGEAIGQDLASKGIYLTGRTLQQAIGVAGGGLKRGTIYEGFNLFGVDLDMNRIAGIQGGSLHFLINDLAGLPLQGYTGSFYAFNRAFAYTAAVRLNEFSYEQRLLDGRLDLRVGRLPVGTEFDASPTYCEFIYGLCGIPAGYLFNKGYPAYLTASTAGIAKVDLSHHYYFNVGVYEDEPSMALQGHLGFPGEDWDPGKFRGVTIPFQIGYRTSFKDELYPRAFDIGGFVDTGDYSDPLVNGAGQNRILNGGAPRVDHGKSGLWIQAEQTIWRPDFETKRALTVFASANFSTSGQANISNAYFAGFSYKGPFAARPNDSLNLMGEVIDLNSAYTTAVNTSLALRNIHQAQSSTEALIELNYSLAIAPGMNLKPNFVYIFNPDQVTFAKPVGTDKHAIIVGLAFTAFLPESFGLPRLGAGL